MIPAPKHQYRRLTLWVLAACIVAGCGGGSSDAASLQEGLAGLPRDSSAAEGSPAPVVAARSNDSVAPGTPAPEAPAPQTAASPGTGEWTVGIIDRRKPDMRPVLLREVRSARNEGFDRVVFEFDSDQLPGYHVEYVDRPVRQCGSGEPTQIAGDAWLQVRLVPANAHTEAGVATVKERERRPGLSNVQELELTCDFEAHVEWVLGVGSPNSYRVLELSNPSRLVVDVRQ